VSVWLSVCGGGCIFVIEPSFMAFGGGGGGCVSAVSFTIAGKSACAFLCMHA